MYLFSIDRRIPYGAKRPVQLAMVVVALCWSGSPVRASTVVAMNVKTLADYSGQVIVGEVASTRSYELKSPRRIETEVVFKGVTYLKGIHSSADESFRLVVPGGRVGDRQMRICCAPEFTTGGRYLLFLLPEYKTFPTVGLDQGAFVIAADEDGVDRVYQDGLPVGGFDAGGFVRLVGGERSSARAHVVDSNHVTVREPAADALDIAMTLESFIQAIQPTLDASHDYQLKGPAGRQVIVTLAPTSLKRASGAPAVGGSIPARTTPAPADKAGDAKVGARAKTGTELKRLRPRGDGKGKGETGAKAVSGSDGDKSSQKKEDWR